MVTGATVATGAGEATVARVVGLTATAVVVGTTTGASVVVAGAAVVVGSGDWMKTAAEEVAGSAEETAGAGVELEAGATDGVADGVPTMVAVPTGTPDPVTKLPSASWVTVISSVTITVSMITSRFLLCMCWWAN